MIWQLVTGDGMVAALLLVIAVALTATAWLPQVSPDDAVEYARQLSEAQTRFGEAAPVMQRLGLLNIPRSLGFRTLLALLAACLLLRLMEAGDRLWRGRAMAESQGDWQKITSLPPLDLVGELRRRRYRVQTETRRLQIDRWPWSDLFPVLAHAGALVMLAGLLLTHLWGWQVGGVIAQTGEPTVLPDGKGWVALGDDGNSVTHSRGIRTLVDEHGPGVWISATDSTGRSLPLQQTLESAPVTHLAVALTEDPYLAAREAHIAIPEAQLIVRLVPQPTPDVKGGGPVLVQVYRSPSGQLTTAAVIEQESEMVVGDVTLMLASAPYARLTATFNPGLWPTGAGLLLLAGGLVGSVVWPGRRFWLRNGMQTAEGIGDLPTSLTQSKGG